MAVAGWTFGIIAALLAPAIIVWLAGSFITLDPSWVMGSMDARATLVTITGVWGFILLCVAGT